MYLTYLNLHNYPKYNFKVINGLLQANSALKNDKEFKDLGWVFHHYTAFGTTYP